MKAKREIKQKGIFKIISLYLSGLPPTAMIFLGSFFAVKRFQKSIANTRKLSVGTENQANVLKSKIHKQKRGERKEKPRILKKCYKFK